MWPVSSVGRAGAHMQRVYSSTQKVQGATPTCDGFPACLPPLFYLNISYHISAFLSNKGRNAPKNVKEKEIRVSF